METHRRVRQIAEAARKSGYEEHEIKDLIREPEDALKGERRSLEFQPEAIRDFVRLLEGEKVGFREVVDFASQLRGIEKSKTGVRFDEVLWDETSEDAVVERRSDSGELTFKEEQKLLLAKNLIEDAFVHGKLARLNGEQAATVAFLANRIAKLIEGMTPEVRHDFVFDEDAFAQLLEKARAQGERQLEEARVLLEVLQEEKKMLEEKMLSGERGRQLRAKQERLDQLEKTPRNLEKFALVYFEELVRRLTEALMAFDGVYPQTRIRLDVKNLLKEAYAGLRRVTPNEGAERIHVTFSSREGACPARVLKSIDGWRYQDLPSRYSSSTPVEQDHMLEAHVRQQDREMRTLLHAAIQELERSHGGAKPAGQKVLQSLRELADGPTGDFGQALQDAHEGVQLQRGIFELKRDLMNEPEEPEAVRRRDEVVLRAQSTRSHISGLTTGLAAFSNPGVMNWLRRSDPERSLYFIKTYLVAADLQASGRELPRPDSGISDHVFVSGREGGFAHVHYRADLLPIAWFMVKAQQEQKMERVPSKKESFVLRSPRRDEERRRIREEERIFIQGSETVALHERLTEYQNVLEKYVVFLAEIGDDLHRDGNEKDAQSAVRKHEDALVHLQDTVTTLEQLVAQNADFFQRFQARITQKNQPEMVQDSWKKDVAQLPKDFFTQGRTRRILQDYLPLWNVKKNVITEIAEYDHFVREADELALEMVKYQKAFLHDEYLAQAEKTVRAFQLDFEDRVRDLLGAHEDLFNDSFFDSNGFFRSVVQEKLSLYRPQANRQGAHGISGK